MPDTCPGCEENVLLPDGTEVGEVVSCSQCGMELEVTSISPVTLVEAPKTEEDWGE